MYPNNIHTSRICATGDVQVSVPTEGDTLTDRKRRYLALYQEEENGCWTYLGSRNEKGYGRAGEHGRAHRLFYTSLVGPIEDGLQLDHLCRNRICVNPAHLEPVTARENVLRGVGLAAQNATKTHCDRGHEFSAENTVMERKPGRVPHRRCLTCRRASDRRKSARRKAERKAAS